MGSPTAALNLDDPLRPPGTHRTARIALVALLGTLAAWLVFSAIVVRIEYTDGYASIINAHYFLGLGDTYSDGRGPLLGLLLVPAEWLATALSLHPLDVRPHHFTLALVHLAYLLGVLAILRRSCRNLTAVCFAFFATIPCFLFFSYAPFLSVDIFPGVLLLAMLVVVERYVDQPTLCRWSALVFLGSIAALTKHTFAVFWFAVLISRVLPFGSPRGRLLPTYSMRLAELFGAACCSGVLTYLGYAWALAGWAPEASPLLRPVLQIQSVFSVYSDSSVYPFPWWIYLRNFPAACGLTTLVLVPLGVFFALRSQDRLRQSAALTWILCFVVLQFIQFKETRYLAFLAPLSALLAVEPIRLLLRQGRQWLGLFVLVLLFDLCSAGIEGARVFRPFYRKDLVGEFLSPITDGNEVNTPVLFAGILSFTPQLPSPLAGDRYHRVFHITPTIVAYLYGLEPGELLALNPDRAVLPSGIPTPRRFPRKTPLLFASGVLVRQPEWRTNRPRQKNGRFLQFSASIDSLTYRRHGDFFRHPSSQNSTEIVQLIPTGSSPPLMVRPVPRIIPLSQAHGFGEVSSDRLQVWGYRIVVLCDDHGCRSHPFGIQSGEVLLEGK